jgi:S1-C subfamily serine protease
MATKVSIISLSIASVLTAILLIQIAIHGSSIQALGQMVVSSSSTVEEKYGQEAAEQQSNIQNLKSVDLATQNFPHSSLTQIFKQVENSVVQITAKTPNTNSQIIINGNPLQDQSTRLGSGFV